MSCELCQAVSMVLQMLKWLSARGDSVCARWTQYNLVCGRFEVRDQRRVRKRETTWWEWKMSWMERNGGRERDGQREGWGGRARQMDGQIEGVYSFSMINCHATLTALSLSCFLFRPPLFFFLTCSSPIWIPFSGGDHTAGLKNFSCSRLKSQKFTLDSLQLWCQFIPTWKGRAEWEW